MEPFSPDYATARARFRDAATALGWRTESHPVGGDGPDGAPLTVDVARVGPERPRRAVVLSSGLHGVEGFLGAAVQLAFLDAARGARLPDDTAVVLLHALNPYGFAWLRRVNEGNVDLNRNFLCPGEPWSGSPPGYAELDGLLNPPAPPGRFSLFLPRAVAHIARRGLPTLKNAVAGGQYDFPKGLFFGGQGPSATHALLDAHLPRWVGEAERVWHLDFHTGLGPRSTYKLLVDHPWGAPEVEELGRAFGADAIQPWDPEAGVSYAIRGGLGTWCKAKLPGTRYDVLAAEFGTVHVLRVIAALHEENRLHHWGDADAPLGRRVKARLRDVFAPPERDWREAVLPRGLAIVRQAIASAGG